MTAVADVEHSKDLPPSCQRRETLGTLMIHGRLERVPVCLFRIQKSPSRGRRILEWR